MKTHRNFAARLAAAALVAFALLAAAPQARAEGEKQSPEDYLMALNVILQTGANDPAKLADGAQLAEEFLLAYPENEYADPVFRLYPQLLAGSGQTPEQVSEAMASLRERAGDSPLASMIAVQEALQGMAPDASIEDIYATLKGLREAHPDSSFVVEQMAVLVQRLGDDPDWQRAEIETLLATGLIPEHQRPMLEGLGQPVSFQFEDINGNQVDTADWKGKVILVDFWATWCGPCIAEMPRLKEIYAEYNDDGFEIVGISADRSVDALKNYVEKEDVPWTQCPPAANMEDSYLSEWGISGIPTMFLIDKRGILRTVDARSNMEELIPQLLAEGTSEEM